MIPQSMIHNTRKELLILYKKNKKCIENNTVDRFVDAYPKKAFSVIPYVVRTY
jgi:hypothetical protein